MWLVTVLEVAPDQPSGIYPIDEIMFPKGNTFGSYGFSHSLNETDHPDMKCFSGSRDVGGDGGTFSTILGLKLHKQHDVEFDTKTIYGSELVKFAGSCICKTR